VPVTTAAYTPLVGRGSLPPLKNHTGFGFGSSWRPLLAPHKAGQTPRTKPLGCTPPLCHRTEPGWECFKLSLTRTPDPIRPTRCSPDPIRPTKWSPDPNRPTYGSKEEGLVLSVGYDRSPCHKTRAEPVDCSRDIPSDLRTWRSSAPLMSPCPSRSNVLKASRNSASVPGLLSGFEFTALKMGRISSNL